jgi:hypothetical protein
MNQIKYIPDGHPGAHRNTAAVRLYAAYKIFKINWMRTLNDQSKKPGTENVNLWLPVEGVPLHPADCSAGRHFLNSS